MKAWLVVWGLLVAVVAAGCGGYEYRLPKAAAAAPPADRDGDGIPDDQDVCPEGAENGDDGCATEEDKPADATKKLEPSQRDREVMRGVTPQKLKAPPGTTTPAMAGGAAAGQAKPPAEAPRRDVQKLIYTAHLTLAVFQVDAALGKVEAIAKDVGGYLSSRADREIVVRVPRGAFEESIRRIEGTGDVVHKEIKAQDVTDEFFDLEVRLKNARAMRDRLAELLQKATVKDAIEIEKELGRITEEIERMEGRLKLLSDKISYSTITVSLQPVDANPVAQAIPLPFPWIQELGLAHLLAVHQ